jgi:hypothetical protein
MVSSTWSPGCFESTSRRSSSADSTLVLSNSVTTSPLSRPARAAGVPERTSARLAPLVPEESSIATPR